MANAATRTVKRTAKKATKKVVKSGVSYAKGYIVKALVCWGIAAGLGALSASGIELPSFLTGGDTIAMVGFIIAGFVCFGRRMSVGRAIALGRTFFK